MDLDHNEKVNEFTKWKQELICNPFDSHGCLLIFSYPTGTVKGHVQNYWLEKHIFEEIILRYFPLSLLPFVFRNQTLFFVVVIVVCLFILDAPHCLWGLSSLTPEGPDLSPLQ